MAQCHLQASEMLTTLEEISQDLNGSIFVGSSIISFGVLQICLYQQEAYRTPVSTLNLRLSPRRSKEPGDRAYLLPRIISTIMFSILPTAIVLIQPCQWLLQRWATDRAQLFYSHSIVNDAFSRSRDNTSSISSCYLPHSAASPSISTSWCSATMRLSVAW
jgi:hypothetical protein